MTTEVDAVATGVVASHPVWAAKVGDSMNARKL